MKKAIEINLTAYEDWRDEIIDEVDNATNITPDRIIDWGKRMDKLQVKIELLKNLLAK